MSTPDQPTPPSGWGDAPRPPAYGQYGQGQFGQGRYGTGPDGAASPPGPPAVPPSGPANPYGPAANKPGVIPLRPLSLGEVFDGAFSAVRHNPAVMLGLVTVVVAAATVLATLLAQFAVPALTGVMSEAIRQDPSSGLDPADAGGIAQVLAIGGALSLTLLVAQPVAEGIITVSVSQSVIGRKLSVGEVWARVRPRLGVLIGWMLLRLVAVVVAYVGVVFAAIALVTLVAFATESIWASVLTGLLVFAAIVLGVGWLVVRLLLVVPALVLEGRGLGSTIARAWRLTRKNFWRILGTVLLASIIASVAGNVVGYPLAMVGFAVDGGTFGWGVIVSTVVGSVIATLVYLVFVSGVVALVYTDARMRREGLDVRLAESAARAAEGGTGLGGPPTAAPPSTGSGPQW